MATFNGTRDEFVKFLGPLVRNRIQQVTRTHKRALNNVCQGCHNAKELQAAHVKDSDRISIIKTVLQQYAVGETETISCDMGEALTRIMEAHEPIEKSFKFLCEECHKQYDSGTLLL